MKILLFIEDDTATQKIYLDRLTAEGFTVLIAASGEQGLDYIKQNQPDIILLDILLSGPLDGFDVLQKIKTDSKFKDIPVIVLTNLDEREKVAKEFGAIEYLVKTNVSLDDVVSRIKANLENSQPKTQP